VNRYTKKADSASLSRCFFSVKTQEIFTLPDDFRNRKLNPHDLVIGGLEPDTQELEHTHKENKEMKRLLMAMAMTALITGPAYAVPGHGGPGMGGGSDAHFGQRLLTVLLELDLTDAQKHDAAVILAKHRQQGRAQLGALREAMENLRRTSEGEPFNEEAIRAAFKGVAAAGEEVAVHRARLAAELKGILTPEQKASLEGLKAARQKHRKGRMKNRTSFLDEWIDMHSKEP